MKLDELCEIVLYYKAFNMNLINIGAIASRFGLFGTTRTVSVILVHAVITVHIKL